MRPAALDHAGRCARRAGSRCSTRWWARGCMRWPRASRATRSACSGRLARASRCIRISRARCSSAVGSGIPPMVFLADRLREDERAAWKPLVLMGSEIPFPFRTRPSQILVPGIPAGAIACMPMLDEWDIPSRLASKSDFPGCFDGFVTQLGDAWLSSLGPAETGRSRNLLVRPDADAEGVRRPRPQVQRGLSGFVGRVHGLRRGRLRRVHGARADRTTGRR